MSKLTIVSIEPQSPSRRDRVTSTTYRSGSLGLLKLNILNISPLLCSVNEVTTQTELMVKPESTQTSQGNVLKQSFNFNTLDHSLEDEVGKINQAIVSLQAEVDRITSAIKTHKKSFCSPSKRRKMEPLTNPLQKDQCDFTEEMLQTTMDRLIEELRRVKLQNGNNKVHFETSGEPTLTGLNDGIYNKSLHKYATITDKQTVEHKLFNRKRPQSICSDVVFKNEAATLLFEREHLKHESSRKNSMLGVGKEEGKSESSSLDWLEWVRRITHDLTLTPQQKDEELDLIVDALLEKK